MPPHFNPAGIAFLKSLARHNDRDWFAARKSTYEDEVKAPMLAVIAVVNQHLADFAPDFVRDPAKCMMRIYRDIRFSKDKRPYKNHASAWWARAGLEKTSGGGFYLEINPTAVRIAAGVYMPQKEQLLAIRRMLLERHTEFRAIVASKKLSAAMQPIDAMKMTRPPQGFPPQHPAIDLILQRQWGMMTSLPISAALGPNLTKDIASRFKLVAPLVHLLNDPLVSRPPKRLF